MSLKRVEWDRIKVRLTFLDQIKDREFEDEKLNRLKNKVVCSKFFDAILIVYGVLMGR